MEIGLVFPMIIHSAIEWLLQGLPSALYPGGVFLLEANGGQRVTGTFIVPGAAARYPVQTSNAQHNAQGMQAELIVTTPDPGLPRGALTLILAMALTSGAYCAHSIGVTTRFMRS